MLEEEAERGLTEARRYNVLGVLGKGGFGTVYLARLQGQEGFVKDVAIKVLSEDDPHPDILARFRDEARVLGLLRDRSIVSVDAPTHLGGRWAVVMEFVDGVSCARLLQMTGPFPPTVALEIVEEVARTLDNLWNHPGPDGQPLHLLHRDLKPPNLQITPTGQVKVLDFGIAKATFAGREALTTTNIGGTLGYIAPERIEGEETATTDIYSLGVVLFELITGTRPGNKPFEAPPDASPTWKAAFSLSTHMRAFDATDRPSARDVERACRQAVGAAVGPDLREWAKANVPRLADLPKDDLVGQTLTETMRAVPRATTETHAPRPPVWSLGVAVVAALMGMLVVAGGALYVLGDDLLPAPAVVDDAHELPGLGPSVAPAAMGADAAPALPPVGADAPAPVDPVASPAGPGAPPPPANVGSDTPRTDRDAAPPPQAPPRRAPGRVEPAASVATPPVPDPVVEPPEAALPPMGRFTVEGDADAVFLEGEAGRFGPGEVPPGRYDVLATFAGVEVKAGEVEVKPGAARTLRCFAGFRRCEAR